MSDELQAANLQALARTAISAPLVTHLYTAAPGCAMRNTW